MPTRIQKTFADFWGELLLVRFHEKSESSRIWTERRAAWVLDNAPARTGLRILDLGCGSGDLDIELARSGNRVLGVDRIERVIDLARTSPGAETESVEFLTADLRDLELPAASFDLVLMFGLLGLMSRNDDGELLSRCRNWMAPGGILLVDCLREPATPLHEWTRDFPDGVLNFRSEYDPAARILHLDPTFQTSTGEIIELVDPYNPARTDGRPATGVLRYLYAESDLAAMMTDRDFEVRSGIHVSDKDHYLLIGL